MRFIDWFILVGLAVGVIGIWRCTKRWARTDHRPMTLADVLWFVVGMYGTTPALSVIVIHYTGVFQ